MKINVLIFLTFFSFVALAEEVVPIAGFIPASPNNQNDAILLVAKNNAITWIKNAYPSLNEKGKIISEIAIDRLQKSTIRRPININNSHANSACTKDNRMSQVFPVNPLEIYICPTLYLDIVDNRVRNLAAILTQNLVHESWHLFEHANNIKKDECGATDFEVAVVESNTNGCVYYRSYSDACGIKYSLCK